jgi:hypothetical protein
MKVRKMKHLRRGVTVGATHLSSDEAARLLNMSHSCFDRLVPGRRVVSNSTCSKRRPSTVLNSATAGLQKAVQNSAKGWIDPDDEGD